MKPARQPGGFVFTFPYLALIFSTGAIAGGLLSTYFDVPAASEHLWVLASRILLWVGILPALFSGSSLLLESTPAGIASSWAHQVFLAGAFAAIADIPDGSYVAVAVRIGAAGFIAWRSFQLWRILTRHTPLFAPSAVAMRYLALLAAGMVGIFAVTEAVDLALAGDLSWLREALVDAVYLGSILPFALALRGSPAVAMLSPAFAVPPRWLSYLALYVQTSAAAVPLIAWLWRFPGAGATPGVVGVGAVLVLLGALGLAAHQSVALARIEVRAVPVVQALTVALPIGYYAIASAAIGLRHNWPVLQEDPIALWVLGPRWALGFVAMSFAVLWMAAPATATTRRLCYSSFFALALVISVVAAHWHWMVGPSSAVASLWFSVAAAGVFSTWIIVSLARKTSSPTDQPTLPSRRPFTSF